MIPFNDFPAQYAGLRREINAAMQRVLDSGWYILGAETAAFETELAAFLGARHCVGVANGTEAIALALMALGIGPGDEVVTTDLSAYPTITGIRQAGATPVVVDIDPATGLLDGALLEGAITARTKAILPVHLYGQSCDMAPVLATAKAHGLAVIEDCAQSIGATWQGATTGTIGTIGCFSFYPTKNLGAVGDGGALATNDPALAERLRSLRNYGQTDRYHHDNPGINSRLDELQAAVLRVKLRRLPEWNARRRAIAAVYRAQLEGVTCLTEAPWGTPVYHLFPLLAPNRDAFMAGLAERGVKTLIHYPVPLHRHGDFPGGQDCHCPRTEAFTEQVFSIPLNSELTDCEVESVVAAVNAVARN